MIYKKVGMDPSIWRDVAKTEISRESTIECGLLCFKQRTECNIFVYDKGTQICTIGQVGREVFMTRGHRYALLDR